MHTIVATACDGEEILPWRDLYRQEMNCQIVHDAFLSRAGWTRCALLRLDGSPVGYGMVVIGGPWQGRPTVCEFYLLPQWRTYAFDLFEAFLLASQPVGMEVQSNDSLACVMLHAYAAELKSESILFRDGLTTTLSLPGASVRCLETAEGAAAAGEWGVELDSEIVAQGGLLFHYNRPYGDVYMEVSPPFRRRGVGSYLVQELKRIAYAAGHIPSARCNPANIASRRTLQKAGFVPCAHMLSGALATHIRERCD